MEMESDGIRRDSGEKGKRIRPGSEDVALGHEQLRAHGAVRGGGNADIGQGHIIRAGGIGPGAVGLLDGHRVPQLAVPVFHLDDDVAADQHVHQIIGRVGTGAAAVGIGGLGGVSDGDADEIGCGMGGGVEEGDASLGGVQDDGDPEGQGAFGFVGEGHHHIVQGAGDRAGETIGKGRNDFSHKSSTSLSNSQTKISACG